MRDEVGNHQGALQPAFLPAPSVELQKLDIPDSIAADIILRCLYMKGQSDLHSLSRSLKLSFPLTSALFQRLRQQQLFEVTGLEGNNYFFTMTTAGRDLAEKRLNVSHYIGPAPVSLQSYHTAVRAQFPTVRVTRRLLRKALSDLVLTERVLDHLGPAVMSQTSLFLYGPTGSGKTSIASRLSRIYDDVVVIPYAVEVDGQIILVYDPTVHEKVEEVPVGLDPRWVPCRRPCITVGGEMDLGTLELQRDELSGTYVAPPQMKANNGIFIIDDFGRQIISPQYLLNRWIVPLDRRVDYLTLSYGVKFQIPFELMVVFATNLDPGGLADDAFLRRIRNKVHIEPIETSDFDKVFRRLLQERDLRCDPENYEYLRKLCMSHTGRKELRACYPLDLLTIVISICAYEERPVEINKNTLQRAASLYFSKTHRTP
ncbi:MAG: AAA family ATPase [Syntrophobacteraceae bacterium]|nr:AAA family ATPase [Syntrophobacteraceae bacterium]